MKKGFTLIELITTFALTSTIIIILLNIVILIKNIYSKYDIKTRLLIEQASLSAVLNDRINFDNISLNYYEDNSDSLDCEYNYCYSFYFNDDTHSTLSISDNKIIFINYNGLNEISKKYEYKLYENTSIDTSSSHLNENLIEDNKLINLKISIKNKYYPKEDFGVNLIHIEV